MTDGSTPKQEYTTPKLVRYGTLSELTQVGRTNPGTDFIVYKDGQQGSVNPGGNPSPPGHGG